jgi:hypothetical protein
LYKILGVIWVIFIFHPKTGKRKRKKRKPMPNSQICTRDWARGIFGFFRNLSFLDKYFMKNATTWKKWEKWPKHKNLQKLLTY